MILIYTTHPSREHAETICNALLEQRLIACANIFPISSMYRWNGIIEHACEYAAILKTDETRAHDAEARIIELHEHKVPCIIQLSVKANPDFLAWCAQQTSPEHQDT